MNEQNPIIKKDASMKLYNERKQLYLEIDISGVGLVAGLKQVKDRMQFNRTWHLTTHYCNQ